MITLYSNGCPMCNLLKLKLKEARIEFDICSDVDVMTNMGMTKVPMLKVNDKLFDLDEALEWLKKQTGEDDNV